MNWLAVPLALALQLTCTASVAAKSINDSYAYFDEVVRGLGIDSKASEVWDIGNAEYSMETGIVGMYAYYKKAPRTYDGVLCVIENRSRIAKIDEGKFTWGRESIGYQVWLASVRECDIQQPHDIPPHSLVSGDVTLEEAKIVLKNERFLVQEIESRSPSILDPDRDAYRLSSIGKTGRLHGRVLMQELIGATFAAPGVSTGPSVYLRIENGRVVVEDISLWIR